MNELSDDIAEELARGYDDPLRFVLWAFPWGESPELSIVPLPEPWASKYPGSKFGPDKWACEVLDEIGQQVRANGFDGIHAVKPIRLAVASGHGVGKALSVDTAVPTPVGVRKWGDIREGDLLWGPDGKPTRVIAVPYRGVRPCYRVEFDDGTSAIASGEHLWTVQSIRQRAKRGTNTQTLSTEELLRRGLYEGKTSLRARWSLPEIKPVEYPERELPIHPYVMGSWLGDGTVGQCWITTDEPEAVERWKALGYEIHDIAAAGKATVYQLLKCRKEFIATGVFFKKSTERFIPTEYLEASVEQRLELLRGLLDTDGSASGGSITYSTTSERLIDGLCQLVRSLGGRTRKRKYDAVVEPPCGGGEHAVTYWRCHLMLPPGTFYMYAKRKADKVVQDPHWYRIRRFIKSIEPVGERECMCVTVDREDGLFLANDFIVTHNSALTAWLVCWILATRPHSKGVVTANTAGQLETKTFSEICKWLKRSLVADMFEVSAASVKSKESSESWRVDAQTCREENSESFAGQHSASSTSFYLMDEASAVPDAIWEVCEGGLTDGEPMMFVFGNPTRNTGRFRECFGRRKGSWTTVNLDSRDAFITNKKQIEEWRKEYGEDSDFFKVRVKGEFPSQSDKQFIPSGLVMEAARRDMPHNGATCAIIGVDVARFGDDDSVIYTRIGRGWLPIKRFKGLSTTQLVAKVKRHFDEVRALGFPRDRIYINVDEGGVGGGPKDQLRDDGYPVRGIQFGAGADDPKTYARLREEMWGRMKLWLMDGGTIPNDQGLIDDLTAPEYDILPGGQIKLESKKDMKKRGLPSPDSADALALTFAYKIEEYIPLAELEYRNRRSGRRDYDPFACLK